MQNASVADHIDRHLLDDWQRGFPLGSRPFAVIGAELGLDEGDVIDRLVRMRETGRITRVGGTCAPNTVSASTLAAIRAPAERIEEVAAIIGAEPGVNHSYLREHEVNLWFVVTGPDRDHVNATLARIAARSGLEVIDLPLVRPFNLDLGFSLGGARAAVPPPRPASAKALAPGDRRILQALTTGLPLVPRPYAEIARRMGRREEEVIERIRVLLEAGLIARLGVIVRHRALGWHANAMVVWDIPAERVEAAGRRLAALPGVTLCYERKAVPGVWPYRLFSMIHARSRSEALDVLGTAAALPELAGVPYRVLFSLRCFKQTGALISLKEGNAA